MGVRGFIVLTGTLSCLSPHPRLQSRHSLAGYEAEKPLPVSLYARLQQKGCRAHSEVLSGDYRFPSPLPAAEWCAFRRSRSWAESAETETARRRTVQSFLGTCQNPIWSGNTCPTTRARNRGVD